MATTWSPTNWLLHISSDSMMQVVGSGVGQGSNPSLFIVDVVVILVVVVEVDEVVVAGQPHA